MFYELPVIALLAAALVLVPLPWHWRARNISTLAIIFWLFVSNISYGVNSIVWGNDVVIRIKVWCDIVTKLQIGATVALPASCFCLCLRLARLASIRQVQTSESQRKKRIILDYVLCFGLPCIYMALHYIVQGHRFDIVEGYGCRPVIYESVVAIFITFLPPLVLDIATCGCAAFAFVQFYQRRANFTKHLGDSGSALTPSRFFRLTAMCTVEVFWGIFVTSANIWFTCRYGLRPWISWSDVHYKFDQIGQFPTVLISNSDRTWAYVLWWTVPISTFIFVAFFAFGQDAMNEYAKCLYWIRTVILRRVGKDPRLAPSSKLAGTGVLRSLRLANNCNNSTPSTQSSAQTLSVYDDLKRHTQEHDEKDGPPPPFSPASFTLASSISSNRTLTPVNAEDTIADLPFCTQGSDQQILSSTRPTSMQSSDRDLYIQTQHMV